MRLLGIPNTKPPTKFEVSSSSSFGENYLRALSAFLIQTTHQI